LALPFQRPVATSLAARLLQPPRFIQILAGPRQVGKTTVIRQLIETRSPNSFSSTSADQPTIRIGPANEAPETNFAPQANGDAQWLQLIWQQAEQKANAWSQDPQAGTLPYMLAIDEIQVIPNWSQIIKGLWDSARERDIPMHVVLLGSAPLLIQKGLTESLAGRYELLKMGHWSFQEMDAAFGLSLEEYIFFGGYPGSAQLIGDENRWRSYIRESLVEPNIQRDILALERVDKPALLRQLFELGCAYSSQILSLDKATRQISGHVQTLAHHLTLLDHAGLLGGLYKYADQAVRVRASPPKFQVHNNALMSVTTAQTFEQAQADRSYWGRLSESAIGSHLLNLRDSDTSLFYWRDSDLEVDFVLQHRGQLLGIEVKSGRTGTAQKGLSEFQRRNPGSKTVVVGGQEVSLEEFLSQGLRDWLP
jgi:uncharacterized protein